MPALRLSAAGWKAVLASLALLAGLITGYEAWHGVPRMLGSTTGRMGIEGEEGIGRIRLTGMQPWSPLRAAGIAIGDVVVFDRWYDLERRPLPGESIPLTVEHDGESRRLTIQAVPGPHLSQPLRVFYLVHVLTCLAGIAFGTLIGWRQPHARSSRALAIAFIASSTNLFPSTSPAGWPQQIEQLAFHLALAPGSFALALFAIYFPDDAPTGLRARMRRCIPVLALLGLPMLAIAALRGLGLSDRSLFIPAITTYKIVIDLVVLACLLDGWRHGQGIQRTRFAWLLATFALSVVPAWFPGLGEWLEWPGYGWLFVVMSVTSLLAYAGLAYAVLRHRVIDLGVALNRSLAVAIAGLAVLGVIKLIELMLAQLARPGDPLLAAVLGAGLAVIGFVAFQRARPAVVGLLDRVFFPRWVARAAALRRFTDEAAAFRDPRALADAFVQAVKTFSQGGGAAVYVEEGDRFVLMAASCEQARESLAHDDPTVIALRNGVAAARAGDIANAGRELALPMTARPGSGWIVLVAPPPNQDAWHEDDVRVLAEAALSVGADLQALELKLLRSRDPMQSVRQRGSAGVGEPADR